MLRESDQIAFPPYCNVKNSIVQDAGNRKMVCRYDVELNCTKRILVIIVVWYLKKLY